MRLLVMTFLTLLMSACVHVHEQRQIVSRSKPIRPSWMMNARGSWIPDGSREIFLFERREHANLPLAIHQTEHQAKVQAMNAIYGWMEVMLQKGAAVESLNADNRRWIKNLAGTVIEKQFQAMNATLDIYFEEFAEFDARGNRSAFDVFVLLEMPATTREFVKKDFIAQAKRNKSQEIKVSIARFERALPELEGKLAH